MTYTITYVSPGEKDRLARIFQQKARYEVKSEIYGCCIKLVTDNRVVRDTWEENFSSMSQNIRSHGRLFVFSDPEYPGDTVLYDAYTKTAFLLNVTYYGWIKSLALSCAGDILEDEHGIFSVHGACVDISGRGLCIVGGPGAGKTTQTYGLLLHPEARVVADDWFFARIFGRDVLAFGSERNFYIRRDLATIWKEYAALVADDGFDEEGRAVADLRWVIGKGRILPLTTLHTVIILKRDPSDPEIVASPGLAEGRAIFSGNSYFNPHLMVRDARKTAIRDQFIAMLLERTRLYMVNSTGSPVETQECLRIISGIQEAGGSQA